MSVDDSLGNLEETFNTSTKAIKTSTQILEKKVDSRFSKSEKKIDNLRNSMDENAAFAQTDAKRQQENFKELKKN